MLNNVTNSNILQPTKFVMTIPDLSNTTYFCQTSEVPGISGNPAKQESPFSPVWRHPDKLQFSPLSLSILLDEDFRNWEEIFSWFVSMTYPEKFPQYGKNSGHFIYHDLMLEVNKNSNIPGLKFKFIKAFPINLSRIPFGSDSSPDDIVKFDVTFQYDVYQIIRPNT